MASLLLFASSFSLFNKYQYRSGVTGVLFGGSALYALYILVILKLTYCSSLETLFRVTLSPVSILNIKLDAGGGDSNHLSQRVALTVL